MLNQPKFLPAFTALAILSSINIIFISIIQFFAPFLRVQNNVIISNSENTLLGIHLIATSILFAMLAKTLHFYSEKASVQIWFFIYGVMVLLPTVVSAMTIVPLTLYAIAGFSNFVIVFVMFALTFKISNQKLSVYYKTITVEVLFFHSSRVLLPLVLTFSPLHPMNNVITFKMILAGSFLIFAIPIPLTIIALIKNIKKRKPLVLANI